MPQRIYIAALLLVASCISWAQLPTFGQPEAEQTEVPTTLANPRATMQTFLEAMGRGDTELAKSTLDLSRTGRAQAAEEGARIATALFDVINRTRFVVLEQVPARRDGGTWVFHRYDDNRYAIVIELQGDGAWRFSAETVAQVDEIFAFVREQGWEVLSDPSTGERLQEVDLLMASPSLWLRDQVPDSWKTRYLGIELYNYIGILSLVLVAFIAGLLIRLVTRLIVRSSLHIDEDIADKRDIKSLGRALSLLVNVELIRVGLPYLVLPELLTAPTYFVLRVLTAVGWFWLVSKVWDIVVALFARRSSSRSGRANKVVVPVVSKFGRFFIGIGVVVFFIAQLGYDVRALLAGLGIGGLVIALAAKDSVENLFGSITILMEMPFGVGDWVKIGDIDGNVEEINLRSTRIRTFEDSLITMPNSRMITSHVENYGARRRRRLRTTLGVTYDTPPDKLEAFCERIRNMLREHPNVWNEKRFVFFNDFGASTLDVMLYCFIEAPTWDEELAVRDDILRRVLIISEEMGVEFAFPTTTMRITGDTSNLKAT